jgi:hypothetical protein
MSPICTLANARRIASGSSAAVRSGLASFGVDLANESFQAGTFGQVTRFIKESQRVFTDHAAVHDPDAVALAEACFDGGDDLPHGLQIACVARQGLVGEREAFACDHQGQHDLLAIAAMIA